jgi:transcriptional regulator with XRE-family HTH domain
VAARNREVDPRVGLLGERVRVARETIPMAQKDLAALVDVDDSAIRAIEKGRRGVSIETLLKLADTLHVPASSLLGEGSVKDRAAKAAARIVEQLDVDDQKLALRLLRQLQAHAGEGGSTSARRHRRTTKG